MYLSKKAKEDIAGIINGIEVARIMLNDGYTSKIWNIALDKNTVELFDKYGIKLPSLNSSRRRLTRSYNNETF